MLTVTKHLYDQAAVPGTALSKKRPGEEKSGLPPASFASLISECLKKNTEGITHHLSHTIFLIKGKDIYIYGARTWRSGEKTQKKKKKRRNSCQKSAAYFKWEEVLKCVLAIASWHERIHDRSRAITWAGALRNSERPLGSSDERNISFEKKKKTWPRFHTYSTSRIHVSCEKIIFFFCQ